MSETYSAQTVSHSRIWFAAVVNYVAGAQCSVPLVLFLPLLSRLLPSRQLSSFACGMLFARNAPDYSVDLQLHRNRNQSKPIWCVMRLKGETDTSLSYKMRIRWQNERTTSLIPSFMYLKLSQIQRLYKSHYYNGKKRGDWSVKASAEKELL